MTQEPSKSAWLIIKATLLLGSTLTVMAGATISPNLPQMSQVFKSVENVDLLVRLILTLPALFIALGAPISGYVLDRFGRKKVLIFSFILYSISGTSAFFLDSIFMILVSRAFLGIAVSGVMTSCTTLIADYFYGPKLNRYIGLQSSFMALGGVFYLLIGGFLADVGWRFPFLIYLSVLVLLPGAIFYLFETEHQSQKGNQKSLPTIPLQGWLVARIFSLSFISQVIFYMIPVQIPFYIKSLGEMDNYKIGLALSLMTLTTATVALQYPKIKKRLSFENIFALIFFLLGCGFIVISISKTYYIIILGLAISGGGLGMLFANINVWLITTVDPAIRGRIIGGNTTFLFLGQFSSPLLAQPLVNNLGMSNSFAVGGFLALGLTLLFIILTILSRIHKLSS